MIMSSGTSPKQRIFGVAWGCFQVGNFYEKVLFVKWPTWRPLCGGHDYPLPFALCFDSHFLGELSLVARCIMGSIFSS